MQVRNRLLKKTEYKGRLTDASDVICPCRQCWHPHDCGQMVPVYDKKADQMSHMWRIDMQCATRYNTGCPSPLPGAEHVTSGPRSHLCKRCGTWLPLPRACPAALPKGERSAQPTRAQLKADLAAARADLEREHANSMALGQALQRANSRIARYCALCQRWDDKMDCTPCHLVATQEDVDALALAYGQAQTEAAHGTEPTD